MTKRDLTKKDQAAWRAVTRHVRPLGERSQSHRSYLSAKEADRPKHMKTAARTFAPIEIRARDRDVRRGQQKVDASFDLHGHTQDSAWRALPPFLARVRAQGAKCVIIITGKGARGEGVLRRNFLLWLETKEARQLVSGYAPAHPKHGGSGAWYVYLRRAK